MAFNFSDALSVLNTKTEWTKYLADTTTHQETQAHSDYLTSVTAAADVAICTNYVNRILSHFNKSNMDTTDPMATTYPLNVSPISAGAQTNLDLAMTAKGYTIAKNGSMWTFS
uniref:Uncharacterized protein n=1 Tax=Pithovirus LCPAC304 TaxID=2506594 RepID=A0A481Z8V0_9VIRU|nr:MAG: hypothetical protein LCPAC304_03730 [Pithovirus LCPAC304]